MTDSNLINNTPTLLSRFLLYWKKLHFAGVKIAFFPQLLGILFSSIYLQLHKALTSDKSCMNLFFDDYF